MGLTNSSFFKLSIKSGFRACLIILFAFQISYGQEFGGNPPSMKWRQIDTDTAQIIYPESMENEANRVANTVHYLNKNTRQSIGSRQKKIGIMLQNQPVVSNGYVALAPFISELYLNALQNDHVLGTNWLDMLTIHEYRHALQFMNTKQGITKVGYYLSGELGWSYLANVSIPNWFWEGDAVVSETAYTAQGRGRIPYFYNGYKSLLLDDKVYNYQKARNGSIKDFVPNHYPLGFLMCNYGREQYGNDFWKGVVADASRYKGIFYPFSKAIKRRTGLSTKEMYQKSIDYYDTKWTANDTGQDNSMGVNSMEKEGIFTSYQYPQAANGKVIAYKESYQQIGGFYGIDAQGNESLICRQGRVLDNYFSASDEKLIWAELGQDERWSWQTYSNIVVYDLETKKRRRLTHQKRYFSPDISHDGKQMVVVQNTTQLDCHLHLLSQEGNFVRELPNDENYFYSYPKWSRDGEHILALVRNRNGRVALASIEIASGIHEILVPFTSHQLGIPYETEDYIYFSASFTGTDNVVALKKQDGELFQVTDGKLGSYAASVDGDQLYFSRFTSMGNDLKSMDLKSEDWKPIEIIEPVEMEVYDFEAVNVEGGDISEKIPSKEYPSKPYSKSSNLLNIHSWSLLFNDPNYEWALSSNNLLNTLAMNLGVRYNRNDQDFTYFLDASYAQYYPVVSVSASLAQRQQLVPITDPSDESVENRNIKWWESTIRPGISVPLNLSSGLYARGVNLSTSYAYSSVNFNNYDDLNLQDFDIHSGNGSITFINRRKKAKQNIMAKYSQYLAMSGNIALDDNVASQFFADSELTFPGLFPNHNLVFQGSFQLEDAKNNYSYSDNFSYARGYNRPVYDYIYKVGANYHLPLFYPDWGVLGILYAYRLRANVFFDYSRSHLKALNNRTTFIQLYNSVGGELVLDARWFNLYDFSVGFRYSYLLNNDPQNENLKNSFEIFIPVMRF